jgi:hypothetical protein
MARVVPVFSISLSREGEIMVWGGVSTKRAVRGVLLDVSRVIPPAWQESIMTVWKKMDSVSQLYQKDGIP